MILEKTRPSIIFAAIVLRKPTILAASSWKQQPWALHPERVNAMKVLLDILSDCPELFALRDRIAIEEDNLRKSRSLVDLMGKCVMVLRQLEDWELHSAPAISRVCTEIPSPSTTPCSTDSKGKKTPIWKTVLHYSSPIQSNIVTMYYGSLILVLQFLLGLQKVMGTEHGLHGLQERIYAAGLVICRSVDYHYVQSFGEQGGFFLLFPLRMAHDAVGKSDAAIGIWLKSILEEISVGTRGMWKSAKSLLQVGA